MIGHFLLTLNEAEENRVLTGKLGCVCLTRDTFEAHGGCLLQTADGFVMAIGGVGFREFQHFTRRPSRALGAWHHVGMRYDKLVARFGVRRVANAIRMRILSNRARRVLRHAAAHVPG